MLFFYIFFLYFFMFNFIYLFIYLKPNRLLKTLASRKIPNNNFLGSGLLDKDIQNAWVQKLPCIKTGFKNMALSMHQFLHTFSRGEVKLEASKELESKQLAFFAHLPIAILQFLWPFFWEWMEKWKCDPKSRSRRVTFNYSEQEPYTYYNLLVNKNLILITGF